MTELSTDTPKEKKLLGIIILVLLTLGFIAVLATARIGFEWDEPKRTDNLIRRNYHGPEHIDPAPPKRK